MDHLTRRQEQLCEESRWDFSDLRALYINCTLKRSPETSNTRALADLSVAIMERNGVSVEVGSSSASTATATCSTSTASMPTTGALRAA
jgi:hypothetical protein